MLNSLKKQLHEIMKSMNEAHDYIIKSLENREITSVLDTLTECQASAIQIGELIDRSEGEGTKTVSILEQYCEVLYQISRGLDSEVNNKEISETLHSYLFQIENSISKDLPTKYEVVFFPYKAAMWDSLESIWKAAADDPEVEAYVVPIPYFDINTDHTYGTMHYEGKLFPADVPIFPWEKYNIKEHRPDAAFIHNPYDAANFVTCVHPDFFASNLKKYTEMLVYVPYFVALDDVEEHFCVVPATIHADIVIVQSEKIKNTYVRYFGEWVKENKLEMIFPNYQDKFLALGSPKFDKVINTKREECSIPEEWKHLMYNADGSKRKIIFYNTTISTLLGENEKALDKIEHVLETFRNNKDILLLWRPHPLNSSTCAALRPALLKRYEQIVKRFKAEGWGIYDDTPDMNRAIAISDAYYGDWSSVVVLYRVTGKPIMIQISRVLNGG